jgi:hypothetical protein
MKSINFLNIPKLDIPEDFHYSKVYYNSKASSGYTSYVIDDDRVLAQIKLIFPDFIINEIGGIFLQEINPGFNQKIHIDPRSIAINYILDLGGETETFFPLTGQFYKIELHKWHWFYANRPHAVRNVLSLRKSITLTMHKMPSTQSLNWLINYSSI